MKMSDINVTKKIVEVMNTKEHFEYSPNHFKQTLYSGKQVYLVCGEYAVKVTKVNLNKALKNAKIVIGFTLSMHPDYVWVQALL